jgi:hypothetical protein
VRGGFSAFSRLFSLFRCALGFDYTNTLNPLPKEGWGRWTETIKCPDTCRGPGPQLLMQCRARNLLVCDSGREEGTPCTPMRQIGEVIGRLACANRRSSSSWLVEQY